MGLPPESTLEDVKIRIQDSVKNPNLGRIEQAVLKDGPRAYRIATLIEILNPETGKTHHYNLKIDSINRLKKDGWFYKPEKSVSLEGRKPDEIDKLFRFLCAHMEGKLAEVSGDLHLVSSKGFADFKSLVDLVAELESTDAIKLLEHIIPKMSGGGICLSEFIDAFKDSDPETIEHFEVAARFVRHKQAYDRLVSLVGADGTLENEFQKLLSEHPWMFGSEYSELLDRRTWARDGSLDFMLRRTTDNYLEIIEIKTAFREKLFNYDKSHDSHYPSSKLSTVLGQVINYIAEIERNRDHIQSKDDCDPLKIRARIIIGRDGDKIQLEALRNFNSHIYRIEVLTFDQLVRIAGRVLGVFESRSNDGESCNQLDPGDDDIPF